MLEFRDMKIEEADLVVKIEEECFCAPWKKQDFIDMAEKDNMAYVVALLDNEIIGGAGIRNIAGDGEITNVAITEKHRGNGYSELLLDALIEKGRSLGCSAFTLEVRVSNVAARKCYLRKGFIESGIRPGFYEHPKEDAMIMWLY